MKGLLTILHPPEALPAGHRLPECLSPSRPQSQHAPLSPLQALHPARPPPRPPSPTQIVMQMILNVVMKVMQCRPRVEGYLGIFLKRVWGGGRWGEGGGSVFTDKRARTQFWVSALSGMNPSRRGCFVHPRAARSWQEVTLPPPPQLPTVLPPAPIVQAGGAMATTRSLSRRPSSVCR